MKKAQGLLEFALLVMFVVVVAISMSIFYNNQKNQYVDFSSVQVREQAD